ncbi:hypothetical protein LCGC14_0605410 [marine sediment metagenome]|uniref:TonB-dependent transporter Oar-like beta-barrel domain-containing protein n=1 Tax=marine sediment metagenome TaxID=412755 RepID=A0A0F9UHR3_9ZZZZ|nr:TonB-dependent receptor [Candidatus Aminicenantes bacterium]
MKKNRILFAIILSIFLVSTLSAQQLQTGSIKGTVTDDEGTALPGVTVTVRSSSLIGFVSSITNQRGSYRCPTLPPGTYTLLAELEGFSTIKRENVLLRVAMVVKIDIEMSLSPIGEEITVVAPSPTVDVVSSKLSSSVTKDVLARLPLGREIDAIASITPGVIAAGGERWIVHGGTELNNSMEVDGVDIIDPWLQRPHTEINYDSMEEVEIIAGALPAQIGFTGGSFVNIVTKSGGNNFSGNLHAIYTRESLTSTKFTEYDIEAMGVAPPVAPIFSFDAIGSLGGPILKDKLWFFANATSNRGEWHTNFIPATILGTFYDTYQNKTFEWSGLFKLTAQISKSVRAFALFNYRKAGGPIRMGALVTWDSVTPWDDTSTTTTANINWLLSDNTFLDIRASRVYNIGDQRLREGTEDSPAYWDAYTGYVWGRQWRGQEDWGASQNQASILLTHFQDNFLGGDHEFKAGINYSAGGGFWNTSMADPLALWYWDENPYYWRGFYGTDTTTFYGDGGISMNISPPTKGNHMSVGNRTTIGAFIQDSWTIKKRLTLNIGLRYDDTTGWWPARTKPAVGGDLGKAIGEYLFTPVYGFNPFGEIVVDEWKDILGWKKLSPRIGIVYDLFGNGKTALKASYSMYAEPLATQAFEGMHPLRTQSFDFYWWDLNNNVEPDPPGVDDYQISWAAVRQMDPDYYKKGIVDKYKAPLYNEFIAAINSEVAPDLNVGIKYLYKNRKNVLNDALYDPDTERWWNTYELAPEWWVPFTTIIPEAGLIPEQEVTMYFLSNDAPEWFFALGSRPEAKLNYHTVELTFDKRMSHGWQLGGSVAFSRTRGNISESSWGWMSENQGTGWTFDNPNYFVNKDGPTEWDVPLIVKLYGTAKLPLNIIASFNFIHMSGRPWGRTVTMYPPWDWTVANNADYYTSFWINTEVFERRYQAWDNVDIRVEKLFSLGNFGTIELYMDIFNLLGQSTVYHGEDPAGWFQPVDENTTEGTYVTDYWFQRLNGIAGVTTVKFAVRLSF